MDTYSKSRPIQAIVFDLDNTLTDFMMAKNNAIRAAADAMIDAGLELDAETIYKRIFAIYDEIGIEHQRVFDRLLEEELGHVDDRIMAAGVVAYRRAREAFLVPYPHVQFTLNRLVKTGYKLAVISDAPRFEAWLRLCYLQLHHIFDVVLTFDDTKIRKPSPVPFEMALERLGVEPSQAVMIGDWPERDIVGGAAAGLHTVYAKYGDTYESPDRKAKTGSGAQFEIDDLSQLLSVLKTLNADPAGGAPCA